MAQTTDKPKDCVHVARQAELDAALQRVGVCIHVRNDADESVKAWDAERRAQVEAERAAERERLGIAEI